MTPPSSLVRLAACAAVATTLCMASPAAAQDDDLRLMGRLTLSLDSWDWSLRANGLPVAGPVLYADSAKGDAGPPWDYVAVTLVGVAVLVALIREEAIDIAEDVVEGN